MKNTQEMVRLVSSVIEKDGADFANQHTAFVSDPNGEMWRALAWARGSSELKLQYSAFVMDMVYAAQADIPDFFAALDCFEPALAVCLPSVCHPPFDAA